MRIINLIGKPFKNELVFFLVCIFCIIPPTINQFLILYEDIEFDVLIVKYLSIAVTISYFLTCIVYLFRKHLLIKVFLYSFVIILLFIFIFLKLLFGTNISPLIILMIAETNIHESSEFLHRYAFTKEAFISYAIVIIIIYVIAKTEQYSPFKIRRIKTILTAIIIVCFSISIYSLTIVKSLYNCKNMNEVNTWYESYYPYAMDNFSTFIYSIYIPHITSKEIESAIQNTKETLRSKTETSEKDSLDIIFVIGESYIKKHAHLYGYYLPTTPKMDEEKSKGNLFAFSDMISPYNATTLAIKNILCTNSLAEGESWSESVYFPSILKKAGFNVYMWDNQKYLGTFLIYTFTINSFLYNKNITDITYTATNDITYPYDGELIESFFNVKTGKHNFIIFHLMGQHVETAERYPDKFNKFSSADIKRDESYMDNKKKQLIAEYDNATLYNDYVMGKIFHHYKDKNAIIVYISDHGEEVYDIRDSKGRNLEMKMKKEIIKYQNDIPFIIWCSDKYKAYHPDIIKDIEKSINNKGMSDNICQVLFKLANIKTPYYKPERNMISPNYISKQRIIYDKFNYDKLN